MIAETLYHIPPQVQPFHADISGCADEGRLPRADSLKYVGAGPVQGLFSSYKGKFRAISCFHLLRRKHSTNSMRDNIFESSTLGIATLFDS